MAIIIPRNDYVEPTECREEVVQGICEAFLTDCVWSVFHPHCDGAYRNRTDHIVRHANSSKFYGFHDEPFQNEVGIKINAVEMKRAFEVLIEAGYHIFKVYSHGTWLGYRVSKRPYYEGGTEVFAFNDTIY